LIGVDDIPEGELQITAIRAGGPGGQHVNKVSTAIQLQFDIQASSLSDNIKEALLILKDRRISRDGIVTIKAQRFRMQEKNREDAKSRLGELLERAQQRQAPRIPTKPSANAKRRRMDTKKRQGQIKALRKPIRSDD